MVRNKWLLLLVFCTVALTQSCVHGDLDDCPPMVNYAVAFKFTHHTYNGDRVHDDLKRIDLFVFDEDNLVYTTTTKRGPNDSNFLIPLDLPMGKYHILAWGNVLENGDVTITPEKFQKGVTKLQDARLTLQRSVNGLCEADLEKIFYGDTIVEIPLYVSRTDTIPLINNTNNIRVVLHWDHTGAPLQPSGQYYNYNDVFVCLRGSNAVYNFYDKPVTNFVQYDPYAIDRTGQTLRTDTREHTVRFYYFPEVEQVNTTDSCVYDFKVLRLFPDNQNELRLHVLQASSVDFANLLAPVGSPSRKDDSFGKDIIGSNTGNDGFSNYFRDIVRIPANLPAMQSAFDRYENYRIDICLKYSKLDNTYFTLLEVKLQDWHKVEIDVPGWAD